mmetsp:Transcript_6102/g.9121  ORF Transcript_6102/g.9121 Transcript_6102/m.9121 type:complete len:192 (+) Transcript_6102:167-742(+)
MAEEDGILTLRDTLMQENEHLNYRLNQLLEENMVSITTESQNMVEIKKRISDLEIKNSGLESRIVKLETKDEFNKYLVVLQDLNSHYSLEKDSNLYHEIQRKMNALRSYRVLGCHYILDDDYDELRYYKEWLTLSKLRNSMTIDCKTMFRRKFGPNFLTAVASVLASKNNYGSQLFNLSEDERSEADEWWN